MTPQESTLLGAFYADCALGLAERASNVASLPPIPPELVPVFALPDLVPSVLAAIERGEVGSEQVGLDLASWYVSKDAVDWATTGCRHRLPSHNRCGTTACLSGFIVLLAGGRMLPEYSPFSCGSYRCEWQGYVWRIAELARLIFMASYPNADLTLFDAGTISIGYIKEHYSKPEYQSLHFDDVRGFLHDAARLPLQ